MAHDFLVADVGGEEGGVYALGHVGALLRLHEVPLREVLLQLLQVLLVQQLDALDVVLQRLQLATDRLRLLLQAQDVVLQLLLLGVLLLASLHQAVHRVFTLYVLELHLLPLDLVADLVHYLAQLLPLCHLLAQQGHVLLHGLVPPIGAAELLKGLGFV